MQAKPETVEILSRSPIFSGVDRDTLGAIAATTNQRHLDRGETLFIQGDPANLFYLVIEGWMKIYRTTPAGEEAVIGIFTRGQSFAEVAALSRSGYPASCEAVTETRLLAVPIAPLLEQIRAHPDVGLAMIASVSRHVHHLVDEIEQLKGHTGLQRVAEFLVEQSPVETGACTVKLPYEKSLIAARLGMKPESLSRVFQRLRRHGVVIKREMAVIGDLNALRGLVDQETLNSRRGMP
jgi:CRP-like cAMP-binding protein